MPSKNFLFAHQKNTLKSHLELFMGKESKIREKETYTIFRNLLNINKLREHPTILFFYKHFGRNEKYANYRDIFLVKTFDISNLLFKFAR